MGWLGVTFRAWRVLSKFYWKLVVASLLVAFASLAIYFVLPADMRDALSSYLLLGVVPLFLLLPVTFIVVLLVFIMIPVTLVAQRRIAQAARRLKSLLPHDLSRETGMDVEDLAPILDDMLATGKITQEEVEA